MRGGVVGSNPPSDTNHRLLQFDLPVENVQLGSARHGDFQVVRKHLLSLYEFLHEGQGSCSSTVIQKYSDS